MKKHQWAAVSLVAAFGSAIPAMAQQVRPDAGTLIQQERQLPAPPAPDSEPTVVVPALPDVAPTSVAIQVTPTAFRFQGNTLFSDADLQPLVADYVGKPTDLNGLIKAAAALRRYYRERGYLLTEVYLPVQQFPAKGAVITLQVLEARIGQVKVTVQGERINKSLAASIVNGNLKSGDHISEYTLDKPVLLLRDLTGFDATANVEPGANMGEADVTVVVKDAGAKVDGLVGVDNFGTRSAGAIRAYAQANLNNPTGNGDVFSARIQPTEQSDTWLYRLGYSIGVGGHGTRLGVSFARTEYALGEQFAALGASGKASIAGVSVTQPLIRSRETNVLAAFAAEHKRLRDRTATPASEAGHDISSLRASILGNFVDGLTGNSINGYSLSLTQGKVKLDPATQAIDQGPFGLRTNGTFRKLNLDYQRTSFISPHGRVIAALQGQLADRNLASAEKLALGGPLGVRGYPVGEGVGDSGAIVNLEYRHLIPDAVARIPLAVSIFYDWGYVRYNQDGAPFPTRRNDKLSSAGLGFTAGNFGDYQLSTQLAWRTDRAPLSDPDKRPRLWLTFQKWL